MSSSFPIILIYMYACYDGIYANNKWAHRVILTLLASTLKSLCMTPSGVVWASRIVKGLRCTSGVLWRTLTMAPCPSR